MVTYTIYKSIDEEKLLFPILPILFNLLISYFSFILIFLLFIFNLKLTISKCLRINNFNFFLQLIMSLKFLLNHSHLSISHIFILSYFLVIILYLFQPFKSLNVNIQFFFFSIHVHMSEQKVKGVNKKSNHAFYSLLIFSYFLFCSLFLYRNMFMYIPLFIDFYDA